MTLRIFKEVEIVGKITKSYNIVQFPDRSPFFIIDIILTTKKIRPIREAIGLELIRFAADIMGVDLEIQNRLGKQRLVGNHQFEKVKKS